MSNINRVLRRERKRQHHEKTKSGQPYQVRFSVRLDFNDKKALMKKSGMSLQKTIQKLVKEYLKD